MAYRHPEYQSTLEYNFSSENPVMIGTSRIGSYSHLIEIHHVSKLDLHNFPNKRRFRYKVVPNAYELYNTKYYAYRMFQTYLILNAT